MIICICNSLNDREVNTAIESGARRAEEVHACCGADVSCGGCLSMMDEMIQSAQGCDARRLEAAG